MRKATSDQSVDGGNALAASGDRDSRRLALYRAKADECQLMAMLAADDDMRNQWLLLANQWTHLSLHSRVWPDKRANLN
jgi:hypothetical protein